MAQSCHTPLHFSVAECCVPAGCGDSEIIKDLEDHSHISRREL